MKFPEILSPKPVTSFAAIVLVAEGSKGLFSVSSFRSYLLDTNNQKDCILHLPTYR